MKLLLVALAVLGAVFCQTAQITGFSSNLGYPSGTVARSFVRQPFTLTFTGSNFAMTDKFAFVEVGTSCDAASAGTAAINFKTPTSVTSTSAVVAWAAADAPTTSSGSLLLALCYQDAANSYGWRYYGTYNNMNYRVTSIPVALSMTRFWSTANGSPTVTVTGSNLLPGDKVGVSFIGATNTPCTGQITALEGTLAGTAGTFAGTATVSFTLATANLNANVDQRGATYAVCWRDPTYMGVGSAQDSLQTVQIAHMSRRNAISVAFPGSIHVSAAGAVDTTNSPTLRLIGWNIQPGDRILISTIDKCGLSATSTLPAVGSMTAANGWVTGGTASTQGDYATTTYSLTGVSISPSTTLTAALTAATVTSITVASGLTFAVGQTITIAGATPSTVVLTAVAATTLTFASTTFSAGAANGAAVGTPTLGATASAYLCYIADGCAPGSVLNTCGATGSAAADAAGAGNSLWSLGTAAATTGYALKAYIGTTYVAGDFDVLANDFSIPTTVTIFPLGLAGTYFVRGPTKAGIQLGFDTATTGCAATTYYPTTAGTDGSWPIITGFVATAHNGGYCFKNGGGTGVGGAISTMTLGAGYALNAGAALTLPAAATVKGATWFMSGYSTPKGVLFNPAPATAGYLDYILSRAAASADNQCVTTQSRYSVFTSDSTLANANNIANIRPFLEADGSTASTTTLGATRSTNSNNPAAQVTSDVASEVEWRVCIRFRATATAATSVTSWFATAITVSQLPTIWFKTQSTSNAIPVLTSTNANTADILVFGALSGDKIGFQGTTAASGQADGSCDGTGTVAIPLTALTAANGVATTKITYGSASTAGGTASGTAMALCIARTLKTADARGLLMTPQSGVTGITVVAGPGSFTNIAVAGGQSVTISPFNFRPISTDGTSSAPALTFKTTNDCSGAATALTNAGTSAFGYTAVTYTTTRDGHSIAAQTTASASFMVAAGAASGTTAPATNPSAGAVCAASATGNIIANMRVAALAGSCIATTGDSHIYASGSSNTVGTLGCAGTGVIPGTATGKSFKLTGFGSYYPSGALPASTNTFLLFDAWNLITTDKIAFLPKATVTATGFTPAVTGVAVSGLASVGATPAFQTYSVPNMQTAANTGFYDTNAAGTSLSLDALSGGVYVALIKVGSSAFFSTGKEFLVVKVSARFPQSVLSTDGTSSMYLTHAGLDTDTGDSFLQVGGCAAVTAVPAAAATNTGLLAKPAFANGYGTLSVVFPTGATADVALANWCYRAANQAADAPFYNLWATNTFTFIVPPAVGTAVANAKLPILKVNTLSATSVFSILDGKTSRVSLALDGSGLGTINDGYTVKVVNSADTDCTNAITAATGNTATTLARPNRPTYDGSDFTLTATTLTATNAATAAPTYKLCYSYRKAPTAAADFALLAGTVAVKPIPSVSTTGNAAIVRNAKTGQVQTIDLTVAIGSATAGPRLNSDDTVCIVPKGSGAPVSGTAPYLTIYTAVGQNTVPATATAAAYFAYCVAAGSNAAGGQIADFTSVTGRTTMALGEYDVYISAGAATAGDIRGEPVKATGSVWVVEAKVRPSNVQVSAAAADMRTVYVNPDWVGSQITFGTACPADGASVTGSAATAAITQAFSTSGVIKICVQSSKDLTAATSRRWIELDNTNDIITVNTGSLTTALLPTPFARVHAKVPLQLNFRWNSHIAQAKDTFRSLIYKATSAPSCATNTAADLAGNDVTMVGQYSATQGDSFSVVAAVPLVVPVQDYGTNGLQEVIGCWKQGSTNGAAFEDFPTATFKFKVVDVSSFVIGSKDVPAGDPSVPRTLNVYFSDAVYFQGRWLQANDFASFVPSLDTDCSRAWWYENAVIASGAAAVGDQPSAQNYRIPLESGIQMGGLFNLCYNALGTLTGYRLYNDATFPKLRVIDGSITPSFATSGKTTTFTVKAFVDVTLNAGTPTFTTRDRATFAVGGFTGTPATCAVMTGTAGGLPANLTASNTFQATLTSASGVTVYDPCLDLVMGNGYNTYNQSGATGGIISYIAPSGNMAAYKNAGAASYYDKSLQQVRVQVFATPRLISVIPNTIVLNQPTTLTFWGSSLSTSDAVNISTIAATDCTNSTTFNSVFTASPVSDGNNAVQYANFVGPATGVWNVCYRPAGQGSQSITDHGVTITVVNVDGVTPTGVTGGIAAGGSQTVTLTGNFNFANVPAADNHWVGLIPRDISGVTKNCAGLNVSRVAIGARDATNNNKLIVTISSAMAPAAIAEYSFCVHFANMPWADVSTPATDYVFINPVTVNFANRGITDFAPLSVVNGTAQTVSFRGAGVRDFDKVLPIPSTGVLADCATTYTATPALATDVQNRQTTGTWALGTYKLCYGFNVTGTLSWFLAPGTLTVEAFQLKSLVAPASKTGDSSLALRVTVSGTGLAPTDTARLVNITGVAAASITTAMCATSGAGSATGSPYTRVIPVIGTPGTFSFDVAPGDAPVGTYGICYQSNSLPGNPVLINAGTTFTITFTQPPRVLGLGPAVITGRPAGSAININFFGAGLAAGDGASIVAGTTATCATPAATVLVSAGPLIAGRTTTNATLTIPGTGAGLFTICYHYKNTGAGTPNTFTVNPAIADCAAGQRYLCNGACSATPCPFAPAPTGCAANQVFCPSVRVCAKSAADCTALATGVVPRCPPGAQVCYDGSCAPQLAVCPAVAAPADGYIRCQDGSLSAAGVCTGIKTTCTGLPAATPFCPAGGCPLNNSPSIDACPAFDGCPVGSVRCSDCTCSAPGAQCTFTGAPFGLPFRCSDGTWRATAPECVCTRFNKVPKQVVQIATTVRRRFVVRASAALTVTIPGPAGSPALATVTLPVNLANENNCILNVDSVAESVVDSFTTAASFIISPVPVLSIVQGNATSSLCTLVSSAANPIVVTFPTVEPTSANATASRVCVLPFSGSNAGSNATVTTVAAAATPTCNIVATALANTAVAFATGAITPKAPAPPATPLPPVPSALPSGGPAASGSVAPSSGPGASATPAASGAKTGSASTVAVSTAILAVLLSVMAVLI